MDISSDNYNGYAPSTIELYERMWEYVKTFPLSDFIVEQNFRNWFNQMVEVGRENDIEFCVNYAKKFSGTKTYALLSEFENMKAWNINEQSIFSNAKDVLENMFFVDIPEPVNGDLLRGTRNEAFAREEYMSYLKDIYPEDDGFTVIQRSDLVKRLSTFDSVNYPWFGGTPDDIIEIAHTTNPSRFIMPDYKCPKPGNITTNLDPEYKHQLCHYDLGCDLLNAEDSNFPVIDELALVKFNVETQSILVIDGVKDQAYKARLTEACDLWWNEFALKGVIPPLQNGFTEIITAADFSDLQRKATDAVRLRDPDFKIDPVMEERINAIPTLLYDFSIAKKLVNEMGKIASDLQAELTNSFTSLQTTNVLPKNGEFTLGCGAIKWQPKRKINDEALIDAARNIGIELGSYCSKSITVDYYKAIDKIREISSNLGQGTIIADDLSIGEIYSQCQNLGLNIDDFTVEDVKVNQDELLKAIELYVKENNLDVDLSHIFTYEDSVSIALSRKKTGTVATLGSSITSDASEIISRVIQSKEGFSSDLILEQQKEFTDRLAYQSRSNKFAEKVLSLLDQRQKYVRAAIPRPQQITQSVSNEFAFVTFSGDIIEIDTGEVIGNMKTLNTEPQNHNSVMSPPAKKDAPVARQSIDSTSLLQSRENAGKVIANIVIRSRNINAEARGKAIVELEHRMEQINNKFGENSVATHSREFSSDLTNLLGADFNLADERSKRGR
jgi:hypothetical protein